MGKHLEGMLLEEKRLVDINLEDKLVQQQGMVGQLRELVAYCIEHQQREDMKLVGIVLLVVAPLFELHEQLKHRMVKSEFECY